MDRRYYYRILGIREGSSTAEIKKAYNKHMRRLALPDYADDPEYVARKKDQIRHAYSVLVGGAAPATKAQKEAHFEKWKDAEDAGEDGIEGLKRAFKKHVRDCEPETELAAGLEDLKNMIGGVLGGEAFEDRETKRSGRTKKTIHMPGSDRRNSDENRNAKVAKIIVACVIGLSLFSSLITACGSLVVNLADEIVGDFTAATPEYSIGVEEAIPAETEERVDQILAGCGMYDYYGNLDMAVQERFLDQVDWDVMGDSYDDIWSCTADISYYLGLYDTSDAIQYITGSEDAYWENDDYSNAEILIGIMAPPAFEEIAGSINLYSNTRILNYADYLAFIRDVAEFQTEDALG